MGSRNSLPWFDVSDLKIVFPDDFFKTDLIKAMYMFKDNCAVNSEMIHKKTSGTRQKLP